MRFEKGKEGVNTHHLMKFQKPSLITRRRTDFEVNLLPIRN